MTSEQSENLFKEEQKYIVKPVAFGKRSKRRSDGKRSKHLKRKKPNKYSRKK